MTITAFLKGWEVKITKLPSYKSFKTEFVEEIDARIIDIILGEKSELFNPHHLELLGEFKKHLCGDAIKLTHYQAHGLGRHYATDNASIITLPRIIKHTIMKYCEWIDIDMVCAHPNIACEVARRNNLAINHLSNYLENRDERLLEVCNYYSTEDNKITRDQAKSLFNILAYGGSFKTWLLSDEGLNGLEVRCKTQTEFIINYKRECRTVMELIYSNNVNLVNKIKFDITDVDKIKRKTASYFYGIIENDILFQLYQFMIDRKYIVKTKCAPEYDGICFKPIKPVCEYQSLVDEFSNHLYSVDNFRMKFKIKGFDNVVDEVIEYRRNNLQQNDEEIILRSELIECENYAEFKLLFEKNHFKVIDSKNLFKITRDIDDGTIKELIRFSTTEIKDAYGHLTYRVNIGSEKKPRIVEGTYVNDWLKDSRMKNYESFVNRPPPMSVPKSLYNLWSKFRIEQLYDSIDLSEIDDNVNKGVEMIKRLMMVLCNNDTETYDWVCRWVGHALKYPAEKSFAICLISLEGAGKGTMNKVFEKLFGRSKVMETTKPERDVWGQFNSLMVNSYIVNINEMDQKKLDNSVGELKGLITDSKLNINCKGKDPFEIESFHRFMFNSNNLAPLKVTGDDRRFVIIRSSDELKGNCAFFTEINECIENDRVIKKFYDYLMALPNLETFHREPKILTSYQSIIQNSNRPSYDLFLEQFTLSHMDEDEIIISSKLLFSEFQVWESDNDAQFKMNNQSFYRNLNLMQFDSGTMVTSKTDKTLHTRAGNNIKFDLVKLKKKYGISNCVQTI